MRNVIYLGIEGNRKNSRCNAPRVVIDRFTVSIHHLFVQVFMWKALFQSNFVDGCTMSMDAHDGSVVVDAC